MFELKKAIFKINLTYFTLYIYIYIIHRIGLYKIAEQTFFNRFLSTISFFVIFNTNSREERKNDLIELIHRARLYTSGLIRFTAEQRGRKIYARIGGN